MKTAAEFGLMRAMPRSVTQIVTDPTSCLPSASGARAPESPDRPGRRRVLAGLLAALATPAPAVAQLARSPRPAPRPVPETPAEALDRMLDESGLSGTLGFAVADGRTGLILEGRGMDRAMPPASVTKSMTALYALEHLGADYRFATRLVATGPVVEGKLQGDLVLLGSGDPTLDTDHLGELAAALKERGVREITGRFRAHGGVLPELFQIDAEQPEHVGYNPAVSGLNLNFNRVHFEWKRASGRYDVTMEARSARYRPSVAVARMRVVDRGAPVYTWNDADGIDDWTVARSALGNGGARWLPVRRPGAYTADVFRTLARSHGILLPEAVVERGVPPQGTVLATHESEPLREVLRDMLEYSTNLTAEAVGLAASAAQGMVPESLAASARQMSAWMQARLGTSPASELVDHSGLGAASRLTAADLIGALVAVGPGGELASILKEVTLRDAQYRPIADTPVEVHAKTGTLNFVSALGGYLKAADGTDLTFAIFTADEDRRAALTEMQREQPPGGRAWLGRSRRLQHDLLRRWAQVYGS